MAERSSGRSWIRRLGANRDEAVGVGDAYGPGEDDGGDEKAGGAPWVAESAMNSPVVGEETATVSSL
jgi:hypothetical protein